MSTEKAKELELTKEQIELNRKRFLFNNNLSTEDPDLADPELAKSLTDAITAHAAGAAEEAPKDDKEKPAEEPAKEEPPKEEVPKEDEAPKEEPAKEEEEEPAKEPETVSTALTAELDPVDIAERAAARALEMSRAKETPPAAVPPVVTDFESTLPRSHRNDLAAVRHLEATNPTMAGTSAKVLDFFKREDAYIKQWEVAHPGESFDADAQEHEAFYDRRPKIDPETLETALEEIKEKQIEERVEKRIAAKREPELRQEQFKREVEQVQPIAFGRSNGAVIEMVKAASPELFKALDVDGKPIISEETIKRMEEADPVAFEVANENAEKLRIMVSELHKMVNVDGYQAKPALEVQLRSTEESFFPHAELEKFAGNLERELAALPQAQTAKDGKRFITQGELNQRHAAIVKSNMPELQKQAAVRDLTNRFWALDDKRIERALITKFADQTKKRIEKFTANLDRKPASAEAIAAGAAPNAGKKASATDKTKEAAAKGETPPARKSPVTTSASDKIDTTKMGETKTPDLKEQVMKSMWG